MLVLLFTITKRISRFWTPYEHTDIKYPAGSRVSCSRFITNIQTQWVTHLFHRWRWCRVAASQPMRRQQQWASLIRRTTCRSKWRPGGWWSDSLRLWPPPWRLKFSHSRVGRITTHLRKRVCVSLHLMITAGFSQFRSSFILTKPQHSPSQTFSFKTQTSGSPKNTTVSIIIIIIIVCGCVLYLWVAGKV